MPSLRRAFSSPSVRSAPYPSSLSSSSQGVLRRNGHGHRRSSGSETSSRRVLADIEWWKVSGGQQAGSDQEPEERVAARVLDVPANLFSVLGIPGERPTTPVASDVPNLVENLFALPMFDGAPAVTSAVAPVTPTRRGHSFESSASSAESSPVAGSSVEGLRRGLADLSLDYVDQLERDLLPSLRRKRQPPPIRSVSFGDFSFSSGSIADFNISPLSSSTPSFMN